jgi:hypothetical protein
MVIVEASADIACQLQDAFAHGIGHTAVAGPPAIHVQFFLAQCKCLACLQGDIFAFPLGRDGIISLRHIWLL